MRYKLNKKSSLFIPKYRRKVIYNQTRKDISSYIHTLYGHKDVHIIEEHMMLDYMYLILSIPPKIAGLNFIWY